MKKSVFLIFASLIFCLSSCEKDELTIPVKLDFEFTMDSYHKDGAAKSASFFDINKGTVIIEEIEFDSRRDQGEDYYFTSKFSTPVKAQLHNKIMTQTISYDIPQGIYNRIDFNISIGDGNEDALCLEGRFQRGPMEEILIRFEYTFQEQIRIRAKNKQGNEQIVFTKDSDMKANVVFDVPHFFQLVNMNMIHNAEITQIEGKEIIVINNEKNTNIFNLLVSRLDNSMRMIID